MLHYRPWLRPCLLAGNFAAPVALLATRFQEPWAFGAAALFHGGFTLAVTHPQCGWFGPVVTRFETAAREVWLTIDDGPAGDDSIRLGEELAQRGARATFFVKGENLARHPGVARRLLAAGHTLANHTQTHPAHVFAWLSRRRLRSEIGGCNAALRDAGVPDARWFRAPVGLKGVRLHAELAALGMRLIGWNVRAHDGVWCEPEAVAGRVLARAQPGAIVCMHEGRPRSIEAILRTVDALHARGFAAVIPADTQLR